MVKTGHVPFAIALQMIVLSFVSALSSGLDFDPDESGFAPTTMDCDSSIEDAFCLDCYDDKLIKKIWVSSDEISYSDAVQIYVYGLSDGDSGINDLMKIIINEGEENTAYEEFYPTLCFSPNTWGWHYFWFDKECFIGDTWNTIAIEGIGYDWTKEILWVGIDKSFPTAFNYDVPDFQRSAWTNDLYGEGEQLNPIDDTGELMIRVYFYNEQTGYYEHDYERDDLVAIDDASDWCEKTIYINGLSDVTMAQIGIWGYAWGDPDPNQTDLYLEINGDYGNRIYFHAYDIFKDNVWDWGIMEFPAKEYLNDYYWNTFKFGDESWDYEVENFAIGLDTDTINTNHSRWRWYDNQWHGNASYLTDQGELMISFCLFDRRTASDYNKEFSITFIEDYDNETSCPDLDLDYAVTLKDELVNQGWMNTQYLSDGEVLEGTFYQEFRNEYQTLSADSADFIFHTGHGDPQWIILKDNDGTNTHDPEDDVAFTYELYYPWQNNIFILESDYSEDGLDCDAEWVWYMSCDVMRPMSGEDTDNVFITLLYHGIHMLFGNDDPFTVPQGEAIVERFIYNIFTREYTIYSAWREAYEYNGVHSGIVYYHSSNINEYFWGIETGPNPDCYCHDIQCIRIP
ncbi:MAG: hypothetical protein FJ149_10770 [Euryarchaeota archaeon]|nr:hypothetical protein [Euryarchaeota archaeon]